MRSGLRFPPGRAGRLWLRHRLATAERGVDLLERKLRLLRVEQQRLHERAEVARREWARCGPEADTWGLRAGVAGGQRALRLAAVPGTAEVRLSWRSIMGVRYPDDAAVTTRSGRLPGGTIVGGAALVQAREAYRVALEAAARLAAAQAAVRIVDTQVTITAQRRRALHSLWIPRLREALAEVELEVDEQERAEAVRRRWAEDRRTWSPVGEDLGACAE